MDYKIIEIMVKFSDVPLSAPACWKMVTIAPSCLIRDFKQAIGEALSIDASDLPRMRIILLGRDILANYSHEEIPLSEVHNELLAKHKLIIAIPNRQVRLSSVGESVDESESWRTWFVRRGRDALAWITGNTNRSGTAYDTEPATTTSDGGAGAPRLEAVVDGRDPGQAAETSSPPVNYVDGENARHAKRDGSNSGRSM